MDPIDLQIAARLRALRISRGFSRARLAAMAGVGPRDLDRYEAGEAPAPVSAIIRFADAMGASAAEVIVGPRVRDRTAGDDPADLVTTFSAIADGRVRRAILDLARSIADAENRTGR